jgi:T5SS/PEP-CTERM-associated repeat protein
MNGTLAMSELFVGGSLGQNGNLVLDISTAASVTSANTTIGSGAAATLTIQNFSTLTSSSFGAGIGTGATGVGTATVSGGGSAWTVPGKLRVGGDGNGTLNVLNGGAVTANSLEVGQSLGSTGKLTVSSGGAAFICNGVANIGGEFASTPAASAIVEIGGGATVNFNAAANFRTNAKVSLTGGTLNFSTVNIGAGAKFTWTSGKVQFSNGTAATAAMLDWLTAGSRNVGANQTLAAGSGMLTVDAPLEINGGKLTAAELQIAAPVELGKFGTISTTDVITIATAKSLRVADFATVTSNSYVDNMGVLEMLGSAATMGAFVANNFGTVQGSGRFTGGMNVGTQGTIRALAGAHIIIDTIGNTNSGRLELSGGVIEYTKPLSNLNTGIMSGRGEFRGGTSSPGGNGLSNLGRMNFSGGFMDIRGDVSNIGTGRIIVSGGGVLTLYDDLIHNGTEVRASAGSSVVCFGLVSGAGPFSGPGTIYMEGGYSPGNSPAKVQVGTQLSLGPANVLTMEIGGETPGSGHDQLDFGASGALEAGGVLQVQFINGFTAQLGDVFQLFASPKTTGAFDLILLPPLSTGLAWNASALSTDGILTVMVDLADSDGDGLPDWWEAQHFGNQSQTGASDADADGAMNLDEFLAGTNPKNAADVLGLQFVPLYAGRTTVEVGPIAAGRTYQLEQSGNLQPGSWSAVPGVIQDMGAFRYFVMSMVPDPRMFYRAKAAISLTGL